MTETPPLLTYDEKANQLLIDSPYALLLGMLLDQQIPMERAFGAPQLLKERLGGSLTPRDLESIDPDILIEKFSEKPALHRFPKSMAERAIKLTQILQYTYDGKAENIWATGTDATTVLRRLEGLPGFGKQKAKIFLALLGKRFGVRPPGWQEVVSPFGEAETYMSVADIDSKEAFAKVRAFKTAMKSSNEK